MTKDMISLRVPEPLKARLDLLAALTRRTKTVYIVETLERFLQEIEAREAAGSSAFAAAYTLAKLNHIPHEVMYGIFCLDLSPIRVWREYLGLSLEEVAKRMGATPENFSTTEEVPALRVDRLRQIAKALGINDNQLGLDLYEVWQKKREENQ